MSELSSGAFMVTGASASGKTSLVRFAHEQDGYDVLPTHTTRPLRPSEENGFDITSIPKDEFVTRFNAGQYLEPDLDFALLHATGVYYGTPTEWLPLLGSNHNVCAMPTSLTVARRIQAVTNVLWVHLDCPPEVRRQRLLERGTTVGEVDARMNAGESVHAPREVEHLLDTSVMSVGGIFNYIKRELL